MKPTDSVKQVLSSIKNSNHIVLFYDSIQNKKNVLYSFLVEGLQNCKGIIYIYFDETHDAIRHDLKNMGIDVEPNELSKNIIIKKYDEWYIEKGKVDIDRIMGYWKSALKNFEGKGLGARAVGETACFFKLGKVRELLRYEYALHKTLDLPMEAICAYNLKTIIETGYTDVIMPVIRAHGKAIFVSDNGVMVIEPDEIEVTDIEKLLDIEI